MKVPAYIGLGSNIGERENYINSAIELIDQTPGLKVKKKSALYETEPVGGPPQSKYLNAAVEIESSLDPRELWNALSRIEDRLGRTRPGPDHPRIIDLDIFIIDSLILNTNELSIPHPRLTEREFALRPLSEIAPRLKHPLSGITIAEHLKQIERRKTTGNQVDFCT